MKSASQTTLGDPPISKWEPFFQGDVDFLVNVASDSLSEVQSQQQSFVSLMDEIFEGAIVSRTIFSHTLRNTNGWPTDVFGFSDGLSQPLFLRYDVQQYVTENPNPKWDPSMNPFNLVLVDDPLVQDGLGSYAICRILEQDSEGFNAAISSVANEIAAPINYVEALAFGRFRDGTLLTLSSQPTQPTIMPRDFIFRKFGWLNTRLSCPYSESQ